MIHTDPNVMSRICMVVYTYTSSYVHMVHAHTHILTYIYRKHGHNLAE